MTDRHPDRQYLNRAGTELLRLLKAFPAALAIAHLVLPAPLVLANPGGAHVVHGQVVLQQHGSRLDVVNTPGAVIHWQDFSIGGGETTRFVQQGASSAVLNRVVGPHLSDIQGRLESNGKVFLINPNGIAVGADAVIDTNGFVASTLGMSDADFMSGRLAFAGDGNGAIHNDGLIVAHAGDVLLVAPRIENSGVIQAEDGSVLLAAGRSVLVADISYEGVAFELQAPDDAVLNLGELLAGGTVAAFAGTLTHTGVAQANSVHVGAGGEIILAASGDVTTTADSLVAAPGGAIRIESGIGSDAVATTWIGGAVDVSSTTGSGGVIDLLGPQVGLDAGARVSADGATGGGAVHVGGNYLGQGPLPNSRAIMTDPDSVVSASATGTGDGGEVILWSDEVSNVHGAIAARGADGSGGFVETSSKGILTVTAAVDIGADSGNGGQWLLDPAELEVTAPPGDATQTGAPPNTTFESSAPMSTVGIAQITNALGGPGGPGGNTVTLRTTGPGGSGGDGVIDVNAVIDLQDTGGPTPNTLIFDAFGDVNLNANIQDRTAGGQTLNMTFQSGGAVNFNSASFDTQGGVIDVQIANGGAGAAVIATATTINSAAFMANSLAVNADVMFNGGLVTLTDTTSLAVAASTNATFNAGVNLSNNVTIGDAGEVRVFGGNSTLQDGTNITGNTFFFSVDPATLTIPDGATVDIETFQMSAGDLFQNGTLNVSTSFNFQGGDIIGDSLADQTVVASGAELIMNGLAGKVVDNHTLVHQSTTTTSSWSQASLFLNNSAVFRNEGFLAISSSGNQVGTTAGVPGTFVNVAGANADFTTLPPGGTFDFNVPFSNDGLFDAFDADINFNSGGTANGGTFRHANSSAPGTGFNNIGSAETLAISNATTFVGDGSNVTSAFTNGNSAILDVAAGPSAFIELLALNSGSVIVQDGAFLDLQDTTWSGGNIVGATNTAQINTLPTGTFTVVTSATARILDTARLIIQAGATGDLQAGFGVLSGGSFENSGTTNTIDNVSIGSGGAVLNDGTFNFNGSGSGPLTIQSALTNNGTFNDATGVSGPGIVLTGGGTNNGTIDISSFGSVTITNNPFNLAAGSVIQNTGPLILNAASSQLTLLSGGTSDVNNVIFSDGLIDGPGQTRIQGNLNWSGGTVSAPSGIFVNSTGTISNTVTIDAGNVTAFGTLNWTGGDILLNNAGELLVSGTFNMNAAGQSITGDANPSSRVRNFFSGGQINVNSPNITLDAVLLNESSATLSSNSSNFRITRAGTAAGTFSAFSTGSEIDFDFAGNFALNGATFNTDTDPMELLGGTFDVGGAAITTVQGTAGLNLNGGDINVQAGAELNATSSGRISVLAPTSFTGPGITRIASDGTLTISSDITLNNHNIIAGGTMPGNVWNAGNITATNDATFTVPVGGDFAIISSTGLLYDYGNAGGVGGFNIDGRVTTGGSTGGVITIDVPVNVTGTLDLTGSADMALTRGGVSVMPTINTTSGELLFNGGTHQFSGPLPGGIFGANFARVQGGTLQTVTSGFGIDRLAIEGGTVQADIGLTAVNDLVWTGGTIAGGDAVTAASGAAVNISGGAKAINNGELVIDTPTAAWSAGNIVATNDGFLTINALARLDLSGTILLDYGNAGGTGGVNVSGDLFSLASSATIDVPVNVTNGLVTAESGVLNLTRGGTGSAASYTTGTGPATLQFGGGTHDLAGVTTFSAPMGEFVEITAGSVITQGNSSADTLRLSGGTLDTRMDLDVNTFEWTGGTITGGVAGRTNVQSSVLISGGAKSLSNGRFRMAGATGTWDAGNITATNDGFFDVNGNLTVTADVLLDYGNAGGIGGMTIEESGTVIGDTPNFIIDIPVNLLSGDGDGEIRANSGRTSLTRGTFGTGSRGTYAANGGDLAFDGGTHVLQAFTQITSTTGDVIVDSGTVNTQTGMINADRLVIDGGTLLQDAGSMIDVTGDLIFRGGSLSGGGMATAELLVSGSTTLTTATTKNLNGGNLVVGGVGLWDAGTVNVTNDGFLRVAPIGVLAVNGDVTLDYGNAGGVGGFEMLGTLNVTTSPTSFVVDLPLFNNGVINVNAGTMRAIRGGDSSGTFNTPTGRFEFAGGSHAIQMGASFTGGGALTERSAVTGGNADVQAAAAVTAEFFEVSGGTFNVEGSFDTLNSLRWLGGTIGGAGTATVLSGSFTIDGATTKTLSAVTLDVVSVALNEMLGSGTVNLNNGSTLRATGSLALNGSGAVDYGNVGAVGTLDVPAGGLLTRNVPGEVLIDSNFNNAGTVQVDDGTMRFTRAGTLGSSFNINTPGLVRVTAGTFNMPGPAIAGSGFFAVEGGTVDLGIATTTTADNFRVAGGTLQGDGDLDILTRGEWQGGTIRGTGTLRNTSGSTFELNAASSKTLNDTRTFANDGSLVQLGTGNLITNGAATITNNGTWDVQSNSAIDSFSGTTIFNNVGVLTKSAGTGNSLLDINLASTGTFSITSGTFQLSTASDLSGTMNATGGAFRYTGGTHTLQDLTAFTGDALQIEGGTLNLLGATSIEDAVQSGGDVTNAGTLTVVSSYNWQGGSQRGAGTTAVSGGATLTLSGAASKTLNDTRTLANAGTLVHAGTGNLVTNGAASITNNGSWDVQADTAIDSFSGTTPFNNTGVLTKSAGTGNSLLDINLTSTGTFSITSGTFQLSTTSDLSGTMNATGGGFRYTGGAHTLQDLTAFTGDALQIEGGTLNLLGATSIEDALQSGGDVTNAGTLTVVSSYNWQGGSQRGAGTTSVSGGATLTLSGAASKTLNDTRTLANAGTLVHTGTGNLVTNGAASITNTGSWDVQADTAIDSFSGTTPFNNTGALTKSAGTGNSLLDVNLTSTGTFSITSGTFQLSTTSDLSGTMNATGGAFRYTGGTHTLQDLTAFTGDALLIEGGTLNLLGTTSVANAVQSGGTVTNGGTLVVTSGFDWQGGSQRGAGTTLVNSGATFNLSGAASKTLDDTRAFNVDGAVVQAGTGNLVTNGGTSINNNGSWDLQSDAGIDSFAGTTPFGNTGTFTKSGGTGTSLLDVLLANSGTLTASTGSVNLVAGGTHSGTFNNNGGSIAFSGGTHNLADGSVLAGTVPFAVTGSALNLTGITTGATLAAAATLPLDNQTLGGTGILNVAGTLQLARNTTVPGTLQVAAGGLLDGRANGSDGTFQIGTLTSDGTVRLQNVGVAASNLSLTILDGTPITNRGLLEVSGMGGARTITGAAIDIDGGTLDLQTGTTVNVSAGQSRIRNGGTLSSSGADSTFDATGTSLGLALEDTSTLFIDTGRIFTIDGDFSFIGGTLGGAGELQVVNGNFSVPGAATRSIAGQTVTINDTTLAGGGTLALDGGTLNLTGTTTIDPGTTLALNAGSAFLGGPLNNNGRFEVNAGTFTINVGGTSSGEFAVSGATLVFDAALAGPGNTLANGATLSGGGTVSVTGNGVDVTALTTPVDLVAGTQLQLNGATINGGGAINATGNVTVLGNSTLNATVNVLSNTLTVNSGTTLTVDVLSNTAAGAVEIPVAAGVATINALTAFNNDGMLNIAGATAINGAFTNGATGTIDQSGAGDLTLDLAGGPLQHLGAWQGMGTTTLINNASTFTIGGNLNLDGATLTQNGGATNWTGTTALVLTGGGVVDLAGTGLTIDAPGSKQLTGGTLMSNTTMLASGANLQVAGGATFTGTSLDVTSGATAEVTDASVTVANTSVNGALRGFGTTAFGNLGIGTGGAFEITSSATSAIATAGTITNAGNVRLGFSRSGGADPQLTFASLVNTGTVTATDSGVGGSRILNGAVTNNAGGTLTSSAGAVLAINGNLANAGTVRADTANVQVTGTTFSNSASAVLTSLAGGQISHTGNLAIDGSTVNATLNAAAIDVTGAATINGALNTTALSIAGGANVTLTQGGAAAGAITVGSGSSLTFASTPFILNDGAALTGGGTFNLGTAQVAGATTGVTINSGTTAALAGMLAGSGLLTVNGTLAASGTSSFGGSVVVGSRGSLNAVSGGALSLGALDNRGLVRLGNTGSTPTAAALSFASLTNSGELRIEAGLGGMRTVTGGFANTGVIRVVNTRVDFNTGGAAASNSGTIAVEGANGFVAINGAPTFTGTGNISLAAGAHLGLTSGQYVWSGGGITGAASSEFVIGDTLRATGTGTRALSAPLIAASVIVDPGTTLAAGASAVNAMSVNVNGGTLTTAGSFGATNVLGINGGGLVTLTNASVTTAMLDVASGTLAGTGTINGNVLNQSIVSVGNSPGILTVAGNYTQTASGTLVLEIGGTAPFEAGIDFDQLRVQGVASLGGTLRIVEIPGGQSLAGQNISPITFASASGTFARTEVVGSPTFSFTGTIGPNGFGVTGEESIGKAVQDALGKDRDPSKNRIETSQQLAELSDEQQDLEGCNKDDADDPAALSEGEHGVGCR